MIIDSRTFDFTLFIDDYDLVEIVGLEGLIDRGSGVNIWG